MIAMQYSFTLPSDYDMDIVRHRIASKGHLMDGFPNLVFKAYLYADCQGTGSKSHENLYAPFYLWRNTAGMNEFLTSHGFKALCGSFGWPTVRTWALWHEQSTKKFAQAKRATRELIAIPPHSDLQSLQQAEVDRTMNDIAELGAVSAVCAFEPTTWSLVRFRMWSDKPPRSNVNQQVYHVGHVSLPMPQANSVSVTT